MAVSQTMTVASFQTLTNATTAETLSKSTNQYKAIMLSTAGQATLTFSSNASPVGVLQNSPTTNQVAAVCIQGVTQFRMAASTLSAGDFIGTSTNGIGIAPTSDSPRIGQILYGSSGAAGRLVTINYLGAQWGSTFA